MIKEKFLFVGGSADGQVIQGNGGHSYWEVPVLEKCGDIKPDELYHSTIRKETYRKIWWGCGDECRFEFFALESLSTHEVISMVLGNYKPTQDIELDERVKSMKFMLERCVSVFENSLRWVYDNKQCLKIWELVCDLRKFLYEKDENKQ